jgi:hypothetical protein
MVQYEYCPRLCQVQLVGNEGTIRTHHSRLIPLVPSLHLGAARAQHSRLGIRSGYKVPRKVVHREIDYADKRGEGAAQHAEDVEQICQRPEEDVDWCSRWDDCGGRVGENLVGQVEDRLGYDGDLYNRQQQDKLRCD